MLKWAAFLGCVLFSGIELQAKTGPCVSTTLGANFAHALRTDIVNKIPIFEKKKVKSTGVVGMVAGGYEWSFFVPFARVEAYIGRDGSVDNIGSAPLAGGNVFESHLRKGWMMGGAMSGGVSLLFLTPYLKMGFGANQIRQSYRILDGAGSVVDTGQSNSLRWSPFFGGGIRESLLGLIFYVEYQYTKIPTLSQITYNNQAWTVSQEADLMGVHSIILGLSFVF